MKDVEIIGMLKSYVNATLVGMGALKGANCRIQSITKTGDTNTVTFVWTDTDGTDKTSTMEVTDGEQGATGADGVGIANIAKTGTVGLVDTYTITLSNGDDYTFTVTNGSSGGSVSDLSDVTLTDLANGQVLVWDATASKWVNQTAAVTVDNALSTESENPVQNKVITLAINQLSASKIGVAAKGAANGVAELGNDGKVPSAQLPDMLELGESSSTAYRGDRGKTAYDHSQIEDGTNPHKTTANNVNLNTALTINGESKTTAEAAISALAGLVNHVTDAEYNSISSVLQ